MGLACETVGFSVANPGATFTAVTMASGDSNRVREFSRGSQCALHAITRQGATSGAIRIFSAVMHDVVRGITIITPETPTSAVLEPFVGEPMQPADTLTIQGTGGTAETEVGTATFWYQDVLGLQARLFKYSDIQGAVEHLKPVEIDCTPNGSAGTWSDTALNNTEDLLKADRKYAVLGYLTDTAVASVAVKGSETGNVRIGGPGLTTSYFTSRWFVDQAIYHNLPYIPVISANNKAAIFASIITTATSGTVKVQLMLALLAASFA